MQWPTASDMARVEERLDEWDSHGLWIIFHDYSARSCAKWVPRPSVGSALRRGGVFARANLNFTIDDQQVPNPRFGADTGDFFAVPDPDTLVPVPYRPGAARAHSWLRTEEGEAWEGCPRTMLVSQIERLAEHGLSAQVAFEPEFTLYHQGPDGNLTPVDHHAMYTVDRIDTSYELLSRMQETLMQQSIDVVQIGSEYGHGQVEINLSHTDPLSAADQLLIFRDTVRALARDAGLLATFMPKPFATSAGNGLHAHLSLQAAGDGADRSSGEEPGEISRELSHFVGGVLAHAPALCGVASPTVNSYKRLQPASWAPAHVAYGSGNRSALVRIPGSTRKRMEFRAGDCTANPYLLLTALLAAGIDGLERETAPGELAQFDLGHADPEELCRAGITMLPRSAGEALNAIEADGVVMSALGPVCGPELLRIKRYELARYEVEVSEWERNVYLERV